MTDQNFDHLIPLAIAEFRSVTGGVQLADGPARALLQRILAGRPVASPAAYAVRAIREAPDPFALLDDPPPRASGHPSGRRVRDVIPNYDQRVAAVRRSYAEAEAAAAARRAAAEQAGAARDAYAAMDPAGAAPPEPPERPQTAAAFDADAWDDEPDPDDEPREFIVFAPLPPGDEPDGPPPEPPF